VDRLALRLGSLLIRRIGADALDAPAAAKDRRDVPRLAAVFEQLLLVLQNAGIAGEIGVNEGLPLVTRDAEPDRQAVSANTVNDPEVYRLGHPAHLRGHPVLADAVNLRSDGGVNVPVFRERIPHGLVPAEVSQQPELDLRIIRGQELPALLR